MYTFLLEAFKQIGNYGPFLLIIMTINLLWKHENLLFYYIVGIFVNAILNLVLKGIIQQPRPSEDLKQFNLALTHSKRFIFKDGIPYDIFGMPSGHAESVIFSTVFIYLALKKKNILYVYLTLSLIIIAQRVIFNYHTVSQVIVGAFVGAAFAYFVYMLAREKIKGHITEKKDDFGPF